MLGNAVPSLLAEVLARKIRAQLLGAPLPANMPLELLPPRREDVPSPEPVAEVGERYLHLVGDHAAHPGKGKGRSRQREATAAPLLAKDA